MHIVLTVNMTWNILNFRMPVVEALLARGDRVTVLAPHDDTVSELEMRGVTCVDLQIDAKGVNPLSDMALVRRMRRHFADLKPDCILSYTIKNNVFGAMAARPLGIPFIPNVSGLGTAFLSGSLMRRVAEGLYRRAFAPLHTVFFQNDEDAALFLERGLVTAAQSHVLPGSGIDLDHFAPVPLPPEPLTFLLIARLLKDKGVLEFVAAARQLKATHPEVRFQLLGAADAVNRSAIDRQTVDAWVAEGVVEYLGTLPDVRPAIAAATCIVLPSYREGAPRTLIEGAAMGRPLIATDVPGCRIVVDHDTNGYLVPVRDADALAAAMKDFAEQPTQARQQMGDLGRRKMEMEFDKQLVVDAYLSAIDNP